MITIIFNIGQKIEHSKHPLLLFISIILLNIFVIAVGCLSIYNDPLKLIGLPKFLSSIIYYILVIFGVVGIFGTILSLFAQLRTD